MPPKAPPTSQPTMSAIRPATVATTSVSAECVWRMNMYEAAKPMAKEP